MDYLKGVLITAAAIIAFLALIFVLQLFGLSSMSFFAPKVEAVRRATFEQSKSYNDGMQRDLENLQMDYLAADEVHKAALRSIVLHRFSVYPEASLSPSQRSFYNQLRSSN